MQRTGFTLLLSLALLSTSSTLHAATLIFPQERRAFYSAEAVEFAIVGLTRGATANVDLVPARATLSAVKFSVEGDGSTVVAVLPPYALAPSAYAVKLDGKDIGKLTISSGVRDSTMLLSQSAAADQAKRGGGNFVLGNAFEFGRLDPTGTGPLTTNLHAPRAGIMATYERAIAEDMPTIVYMYWTGYVTHKPFGTEKSWAAPEMTEAMRLLSFHAGQRLRRFQNNIVSVGCIDEPGLSWGKTPAGGSASGFPNRDEVDWYASRGWKFTDDPAARPTDDWMKYIKIRCAIMKEQCDQAKKDLKTSWPGMVFSTDLYAPHAIMDGTDPMNQQINDIPSSHVFVDFGIDRMGAYSGVMLEKAHNPSAKLAHAMNGQLFGDPVKGPPQMDAYRAALNGMMAAGLSSNWWLNAGSMSEREMELIHTPAKRLGALLRQFEQTGHDVAVLWSFTEISMREKEITTLEAKKKTGEQIKLMIASLPENTAMKNKDVQTSAYTVGGNYKEAILTGHYALSRAGYPAHIIDERLIPGGALKKYKTLILIGQTFEFPKEVQTEIDAFIKAGGKIVVDKSTTVKFPGTIVADVDLKGLQFRWTTLFDQDPKSFKTIKESSYFQTNYFMDEPARNAVLPFKKAMQQTASMPRLETESPDLLIERHFAGEGSITLVANTHKELPKIGDNEKYPIYQYAVHDAKYRLKGLPDKSVVYVLEGADWSKTDWINNPTAEITGHFEPGEMKVYLTAPRPLDSFKVEEAIKDGVLKLKVTLNGLKMPWPLTIRLSNEKGDKLLEVHRATGPDGVFEESFPIGGNDFLFDRLMVESRIGGGGTQFIKTYKTPDSPPASTDLKPTILKDKVRVFDEETIQKFLAAKPTLTIAYADAHKAQAEALALALNGRGIKTAIKPEMDVLKKVAYPRVWNPYAKVYKAGDKTESLEGKKIDSKITLDVDRDGKVVVKTDDGKVIPDWHKPNSLVTITGEGFMEWSGDSETCYEPGVKFYVDAKGAVSVVKGIAQQEATTQEFRTKWAKPWSRLTSYVGGYQLPAQLPEAYTVDGHLIVMGDSTTSKAVAVLQASDLLMQVADKEYPGPGKALLSFAWSPFAVEKDVIVIASADDAGIKAGVERLLALTR